MLPATPAVRMVAPALEEGSGEGEATPLLSEESDSGKSYEATQDDATISQGDVEIAVRVAQASVNTSRGPAKTSKGGQAAWNERLPRPWGQRQLAKSHSP